MSVPSYVYDLKFTSNELKKINRLRTLDEYRNAISWALGIIVFLAIFLVQSLFHGISVIHALCTYGCIPAGIGLGFFLDRRLDTYVHSEFRDKWDPLFQQRSGETEYQYKVQQEILTLTENFSFMSMPIDEQSRHVNEVYKRHGLPEPNKF